MIKAILDTNIIISSLVFGGKIQQIMNSVFNQDFEMISCSQLEDETLRILVSKFGFSFEDLTLAKKLLKIATIYEIQKPYPKISRDQNDNYLLSLIEVSSPQLLITGDKDLLVLSKYKNCKIIKASEFLKSFEI